MDTPDRSVKHFDTGNIPPSMSALLVPHFVLVLILTSTVDRQTGRHPPPSVFSIYHAKPQQTISLVGQKYRLSLSALEASA